MKTLIAGAAAVLALMAVPAAAQNITAPAPTVPAGITVEAAQVPGPSLEGNLEGNATVREAIRWSTTCTASRSMAATSTTT
jgi:hypothetical protein